MSDDASNESPTSEEGPRELYQPRREELCSFGGGAGGNEQTDLFIRMVGKDSRLNRKFTIVGSPITNANDPAALFSGRNLTIWIYEEEWDEARGRWVRCVDLAGSTATAPLALPANAALGGFSREFVSSASAIGARIRVPVQAAAGIAGSIYVQATFQPHAVRINPWRDWDEVRRECKFDVLQSPLRVP